jgi:iron complex transport system permease protein
MTPAAVDVTRAEEADGIGAPRRTRRRQVLVVGLIAMAALLVVSAVLSLALGARSIPIGDVFDAVLRFDESRQNHVIIRDLRLPRTIVGLLAGAALGLAGVLMQGVTRNPLADPYLLGVEAGASFGVVLAVYVFGLQSLSTYVWFGFAGAGVAAVVVFALGSIGRARTTPVKLALGGAAIAALLTSLTSALLFLDRLAFQETRFWLVGSLAGRDMVIVGQAAPFIVAGVVMALALGRALDMLSLGQDLAKALGQRVLLTQTAIILSITLMTGGAVAACGPIAFVGFFVPHIARTLTGPANRWILAYTVFLAPSIILVSDVIGRLVVRPSELEVGVVTALVGAPLFVAMVRRRRLAEL